MGVTLGDAIVYFRGDDSHVNKTMDQTERRTQSWAGRVGGFVSNALSTATGFLLANGVMKVADSLTSLGPKLISMGSDAEEMMGKFNVVFGDEAERTISKLDEMTAAMGRSKFEARGFAASFQDTFVPMGFSRDAAADLSTQLTELTYDVASFNNSLEPDVARDFQSALVGNHETVRKYGIVITQAALEQELLNMGFQGGIENATEQQKVQARLNMILKGTTDAQGDAIRTGNSWANQMRALKSTISDVGTEIGLELLPVFTPMLSHFRELAQEWGPKISDMIINRVIPAFQNVITTFGSVANFFSQIWQQDSIFSAVSYLGEWLVAAFDAFVWPVMSDMGTRFWDWLTGEYGALNAGIFLIQNRFIPQIVYQFSMLWPAIWGEVKKWSGLFWDWLTDPDEGAIKQASDKLNELSIAFSDWVNGQDAQDALKMVGEKIGEALGTGIKNLFSGEKGDKLMGDVGDSMFEAAQRNVKNFENVGATIEAYIIKGLIEALTGKDVADSTAEKIREVLLNIVELTSPASIGRALFNGIWQPFANSWGAFVSMLKGEEFKWDPESMMPKLPGMASGGVVPGPLGQATPIIAHGGEVVLNPDQQAALARETRVYIQTLNLNGVQNVSAFLAELEALT